MKGKYAKNVSVAKNNIIFNVDDGIQRFDFMKCKQIFIFGHLSVMENRTKICCFCGSINLKLKYRNLYHPFKDRYGPFNFFECLDCGSGLTLPPPSDEELQSLYNCFEGGMIPFIQDIRKKNPLVRWYEQCIGRAVSLLNISNPNDFLWWDVGAGNGEVSAMMSEKFPSSRGVAIDFHQRPDGLKPLNNIRWEEINLNNPEMLIGEKVDLVLLITVLEHVLFPDALIGRLIQKIKKGGVLYITVPDFGSIASKVLQKKWPYILPGEHLFIPSKKGMMLMLSRLCKREFPDNNFQIETKSIILPYPAGYYLNYFGWKKTPSIFSKMAIGLPTGLLEATVKIK